MKASFLGTRFLGLAIMAACVLAVAESATAISIFDAPSWRGDVGSTYHEWGFDTNATPAAPSVIVNPYGDGSASINIGGAGGHYDGTGIFAYPGFWEFRAPGSITIEIDNSLMVANPSEVWVQVLYVTQPVNPPVVSVTGASPVSDEIVHQEPDPPSQWFVQKTVWDLPSGSSQMQIIIAPDAVMGSAVSHIVVDALTVPEPAALIFLAAGGLVMFGHSRRRR